MVRQKKEELAAATAAEARAEAELQAKHASALIDARNQATRQAALALSRPVAAECHTETDDDSKTVATLPIQRGRAGSVLPSHSQGSASYAQEISDDRREGCKDTVKRAEFGFCFVNLPLSPTIHTDYSH
jgi:hypothetical protein